MQTIEEYKEYTKQIEVEVGKWHNAYDALVIERNALVSKLLQYEKTVEISTEDSTKCVALSRKTYDAIVSELDELRKHEVEWDLSKARIQELMGDKAQLEETVAVLQMNAKNKSAKNEEINAVHQKSLARLEKLVNKKYPDEEEDHAEADGILCDMLNALGYKDLTDLWDKIGKWYS